jgi:hypothetical protein
MGSIKQGSRERKNGRGNNRYHRTNFLGLMGSNQLGADFTPFFVILKPRDIDVSLLACGIVKEMVLIWQ